MALASAAVGGCWSPARGGGSRPERQVAAAGWAMRCVSSAILTASASCRAATGRADLFVCSPRVPRRKGWSCSAGMAAGVLVMALRRWARPSWHRARAAPRPRTILAPRPVAGPFLSARGPAAPGPASHRPAPGPTRRWAETAGLVHRAQCRPAPAHVTAAGRTGFETAASQWEIPCLKHRPPAPVDSAHAAGIPPFRAVPRRVWNALNYSGWPACAPPTPASMPSGRRWARRGARAGGAVAAAGRAGEGDDGRQRAGGADRRTAHFGDRGHRRSRQPSKTTGRQAGEDIGSAAVLVALVNVACVWAGILRRAPFRTSRSLSSPRPSRPRSMACDDRRPAGRGHACARSPGQASSGRASAARLPSGGG